MNSQAELYKSLPKVELHRHLEGSLRLKTMQEIARASGITVPTSTGPLSSLVQVQTSQPHTYQNFLDKFNTLRMFYRSPEFIQRVTREAVEDAAQDNIRHLELRFTPIALSRAQRFPLGEVMDWVCDSASKAGKEFGLGVILIASVNRHESVEMAEQVAWLASTRIGGGILGLDLAGNEAEFSALPFAGVFRDAEQAGLKLTVHAGEWAGANNVHEALQSLNAGRIGHGVRVLEDPNTMALARERGTVFEVCITSNYQTGVVFPDQKHPIMKMINAGLKVTLGTDNPSISQTTLTDEYQRACENQGMERKILKERILGAARASFLPAVERTQLIEELRKELSI